MMVCERCNFDAERVDILRYSRYVPSEGDRMVTEIVCSDTEACWDRQVQQSLDCGKETK